jgi:hypothetical protein
MFIFDSFSIYIISKIDLDQFNPPLKKKNNKQALKKNSIYDAHQEYFIQPFDPTTQLIKEDCLLKHYTNANANLNETK